MTGASGAVTIKVADVLPDVEVQVTSLPENASEGTLVSRLVPRTAGWRAGRATIPPAR